MKKPNIFIACDTDNLEKIRKIIKQSQTSELNIGYKFGLQFLNSKNGRKFVSSLKNKLTFGDYKLADIPVTCASAVKAVSDLKFVRFGRCAGFSSRPLSMMASAASCSKQRSCRISKSGKNSGSKRVQNLSKRSFR